VGIKNIFGFGETDKTSTRDFSDQNGGQMNNNASGVSRIDPDLDSMGELERAPAESDLDYAGTDVAEKVYQGDAMYDPDDGMEGGESAALEKEQEKGVSVISKEASVQGNIITDGHIDIMGTVTGDISAKGNVAVQGNVTGNVTGEKIGLYECRIKGNLTAGSGVVADAGSTVVGDVMTKNLIMDGKLKGDVKASNVVVLRNNAYFIGDVSTSSLAVEAGAVINGNVKMLADGDPEVQFER